MSKINVMLPKVLNLIGVTVLAGCLFLSCSENEDGGSVESISSNEQVEEVVADMNVEGIDDENSMNDVVLESESVPNEDWQINNYANHLIGENIAASPEFLSSAEGINWFYQTLDIKGGFASVTGAIEGWKEFVVWRMEDGDDLVGEMSAECGPACGYEFKFYKGRGADIKEYEQSNLFPLEAMKKHSDEMTVKILKKYPVDYPEDSQWVYNFPQKGTGMVVDVVLGADEIQVPIIELAWNKTNFTIKKLLNDPNPKDY